MSLVSRLSVAGLAALAFLFASVANVHAHVHLCLDGQESTPAGQHVHEAGHLDHHSGHDHSGHDGPQEPAAAHPHDDVDVDVPAEVLAKTLKQDLPAMAAGSGMGLQLEAAPRTAVITDRGTGFHPSPPPYWRPPLRGPPH